MEPEGKRGVPQLANGGQSYGCAQTRGTWSTGRGTIGTDGRVTPQEPSESRTLGAGADCRFRMGFHHSSEADAPGGGNRVNV
jgi:hypothetical protein